MLAGEPWRISREEFLKLDDWYIRNVLLHERDDKGNILPQPKSKPRTYEDDFRFVWRQRGLSEAQVSRKWSEYLEQMKAKNDA